MKLLLLYAKEKHQGCQDWSLWKQGNIPGFRILINSVLNWARVFEGHVGWCPDFPIVELDDGRYVDLKDLGDVVVHVQLCSQNFELIGKIKEYAPEIKVIASIDYGLRLWGLTTADFNDLEVVKQQLLLADRVFAVEPQACQLLSELLGKTVPLIAHPYDIETTAGFTQEPEEPKRAIMLCHRYDADYHQPSLVFYGLPVKTMLIGAPDPRLPQNKAFAERYTKIYNDVYSNRSFEFLLNPDLKATTDYMNQGGFLPTSYIAYDSYALRVWGRWQMDCAALKIPCIGSNLSYAQSLLFPALTTDYYDVVGQRAKVKQLLNSRDFRDECAEIAWHKLQAYGFEPSRQRYEELLGAS